MTQKALKNKKYPLVSKHEFLRRFTKLFQKEKITYNEAKLINKSYNEALGKFCQTEIFSNWIRIDRNKYYKFKNE
jgi:hypothetical protein